MDFVLELAKLIKRNPRLSVNTLDSENCDYNNFLYKSKNCYLCFSSSILESCFYLDNSSNCKDCMDCDFFTKSELCYSCTDCDSCYNCNFSRDLRNCTDCNFCSACQTLKNCFGCVGLQMKEFHIFNKPYSQENYLREIARLKTLSREEIMRKTDALEVQSVHPFMHVLNSENVWGDYIANSKNCFMCFYVENSEDSAYLYDEIYNLKDCVDCTHIHNSELCYNLMSADHCYSVNCSWVMTNCRDCDYCIWSIGCSNCFGCVNIKRKEYYILNKQYTKEEYYKRVAAMKEDLKRRELHGNYLVADAIELAGTL